MCSASKLAICALLTAVTLGPPSAGSGDADAAVEPIVVGVVEPRPADPEGVVAGAVAAAEEINAAGGVAGRPLSLVVMEPGRPWRDGAPLMAKLAFERRAVALIGPTDGADAHLAAQIATRGRLPIIVLSPEASLTRASVPWIFRGVPDDVVQARALLEWAFEDPSGKRVAAAVPAGREGRERLAALAEACGELGAELEAVERGARLRLRSADALLLWLDPGPALALLEQPGETPPIVLGSTRLDTAEFLEGARDAGSIAMPMLGGGDRYGYDSVMMLASAAVRAGPDPEGIQRELRGALHEGRSGSFRFDEHGNRSGDIRIGVVRGARLIAAPRKRASHEQHEH